VGINTIEYLSQYRADIAFMSCRGFGIHIGAMEASEDEYHIKKLFMQNSKSSFLLCDSSKKDQEYLCKIAPLAHFTGVITEKQDLNKMIRNTLSS
jgi:DeoR/GlpR family transcriptional regulator of sugar metabolism